MVQFETEINRNHQQQVPQYRLLLSDCKLSRDVFYEAVKPEEQSQKISNDHRCRICTQQKKCKHLPTLKLEFFFHFYYMVRYLYIKYSVSLILFPFDLLPVLNLEEYEHPIAPLYRFNFPAETFPFRNNCTRFMNHE